MKTKKMILISGLLLVVITVLACCKKEEPKPENNCGCEYITVKILQNEPAYITTSCSASRVDTFYIDLINSQERLFTCTEIPVQYQVEGTLILISGNITDSIITTITCNPLPNEKYAPIPANMFDLTSIKSAAQ